MLRVLPQPPPVALSTKYFFTFAAAIAAIALASASVAPTGASATATNTASALEDGQTIVQPRWWTGTHPIDPSRYIIDGHNSLTKADLHDDSNLAHEMRRKFADVGLVYVTNTGLKDMRDQRKLARIIMGDESEYEGGANPRNRDQELGSVYDIGAPLEAALAYHHGEFTIDRKYQSSRHDLCHVSFYTTNIWCILPYCFTFPSQFTQK